MNLTVIHGDSTTTAATKGGDNLGDSGHKHFKGDKVVAFCERDCNVISPFIAAAGNRKESPLLRDVLPKLSELARATGMDLQGSTVSPEGGYNCRTNLRALLLKLVTRPRPVLYHRRRDPDRLRVMHLRIPEHNFASRSSLYSIPLILRYP